MIGEEAVVPIDSIKPNDWNPNDMGPMQYSSLKHGLKNGWSKSQLIMVWRSDERGRVKNIIIDGEHRWGAAKELGYAEVPVVFVDGMTEAQAKKWTLRFIFNHGDPDINDVNTLLKSLKLDDVAVASLEMGIDPEFLQRALQATDTSFLRDSLGAGGGGGSAGPGNVEPESYTLVFAFGHVEDKNRVLEVLDKMNKETRSAALLELVEKFGSRL